MQDKTVDIEQARQLNRDKRKREDKKRKKTNRLILGIIMIVLGLGVFFWAKSHSPHMGFGQMLMKMDSFILKEPAYYGVLIIAAILGIVGIINIVKGLQAE